jgi:hypothetical protein
MAMSRPSWLNRFDGADFDRTVSHQSHRITPLKRMSLCVITCAFLLVTATASAAEHPLAKMPELRKLGAYVSGPVYHKRRRLTQKVCNITPGEGNSVLKPGVVLELLRDRSITGLHIFGAPGESTLESNVYYQVEIAQGVLAELGKLRHLDYLTFYGVDLSGKDGLEFLGSLQNLKMLSLAKCHIEMKDVVAHLSDFPHLQKLYVTNDRFDYRKYGKNKPLPRVVEASEIAKLVKGSPKLEFVSLVTNDFYRPEAIALFRNLESLNRLNIAVSIDRSPAFSSPLHPNQVAAGKKLDEQFQNKGFVSPTVPRTNPKKDYWIPNKMIYVPEIAERAAGERRSEK